MSSEQPSQYELGKTLGNMEGHLESIDKRLEEGSTTMKEIKTEQKRITGCVHSIEKEFEGHKEKPHLYNIMEERTKFQRLKRHWLEVAIGSGTGIVGVVLTILNHYGVI